MRKRIVAYGFRNPFRFTFRPGTSELWIGDVGWDTWEEIDRVGSPTSSPSLDFGWPCYEGNGAQPGYQSANLNLCTSLYSAGTATSPYYTYSHSSAVVANDGCPTANGSSVTGDAFYDGGSYPAAYQGALVFADHTRNCIWAMLAGSNGLPDPTKLQLLVGGAANPVDVETGPGGDIFYADLDGGTIHRISYAGGGGGGGGGTCSGQFEAKYFNNMTLSGTPVLDQCEAAVDHDWGSGSPGPGVNANGFSASWDGSFAFAAGTYAFTATGDDGIRLFVDGTKVIDGWKDQSATTYTASIDLTAGSHAVRVEYYDNTVDAVAKAGWQLTSSGGGGGGGGGTCSGQFEAKYFNNMTLSGTPVLDQCEAAVDHDWGSGSPGPGVNANGFSASWDGSFAFAAGTYAFTATGDDGIRLFVDGTKVIDGWKDQSATTYTASIDLTAGSHAVRVEYYDNTVDAVAKAGWQAASTSNAPPSAVIDSPSSTVTYAVGDSISFSGHGTDTEDGTLAPSALAWTLIIHHCPSPGNCHTHTVQTWSGIASGTLSAPDHDYPSYLELQLTAKDSAGATSTSSVQLSPKTVDLTFASAPSGLSLTVGASTSVTPFVRTVIVKSSNSISAPTPQSVGPTTYTFSSWSDGGSATHNIVAPAAGASYTATYSRRSPPSSRRTPCCRRSAVLLGSGPRSRRARARGPARSRSRTPTNG